MGISVPTGDQRLSPGEARVAREFYLIYPVECRIVECFVPSEATAISNTFQIILTETTPDEGVVVEFEGGLGSGETSSRTVSFNASNVLKIYVKNPSGSEYVSIDELHIRVEALEKIPEQSYT